MSSVVRRAAAPLLAIVVLGSMATAGAVAQDASPGPGPTLYPLPSPLRSPTPFPQPSPGRDQRPPGPLAPDDPARCQLWEDQQAPVVTRPRFAAVGVGVSAAAVEAEPIDASCALSQASLDGVPSDFRDWLEDVGAGELFVTRPDAVGDMLTLTGGPFTGDPDPALDITGVSYGSLDLNRSEARRLARALERDEFADEVSVTFSGDPSDWIERGLYGLTILELAGDPTQPTETQRIWQLGFQGRDPAKSVRPTIPVGSPIAGVRNLLTYAHVAQEGGTLRRTIGRSDFGSSKVGPDGQTQYYNARPDAAVLEWSDAVAFLYPAAYGPLGLRPMAFHRESGAWDIVSAPGGPMAFLPASGIAPGMFDFAGLVLRHDPISLPAMIGGVASDSPLSFPSQNGFTFGSRLFDPTRPVLVDLAYAVDGHEVGFVDLEAQPLGAGLFGVPYGIPQYGAYHLTGLDLAQAGISVPESWDQLVEALRSVGVGGWQVGEEAGPLHGTAIHDSWATSPGWAELVPYDPDVAAQVLREAGFLSEP